MTCRSSTTPDSPTGAMMPRFGGRGPISVRWSNAQLARSHTDRTHGSSPRVIRRHWTSGGWTQRPTSTALFVIRRHPPSGQAPSPKSGPSTSSGTLVDVNVLVRVYVGVARTPGPRPTRTGLSCNKKPLVGALDAPSLVGLRVLARTPIATTSASAAALTFPTWGGHGLRADVQAGGALRVRQTLGREPKDVKPDVSTLTRGLTCESPRGRSQLGLGAPPRMPQPTRARSSRALIDMTRVRMP